MKVKMRVSKGCGKQTCFPQPLDMPGKKNALTTKNNAIRYNICIADNLLNKFFIDLISTI